MNIFQAAADFIEDELVAEYLTDLGWIADGPGPDPAVRLRAGFVLNSVPFQLTAHRVEHPSVLSRDDEIKAPEKLINISRLLFEPAEWRAWVLVDEDLAMRVWPEEIGDPMVPPDPACVALADEHRRRFGWRGELGQGAFWHRPEGVYVIFAETAERAALHWPQVLLSRASPVLRWQEQEGARAAEELAMLKYVIGIEGIPLPIFAHPCDFRGRVDDETAFTDHLQMLGSGDFGHRAKIEGVGTFALLTDIASQSILDGYRSALIRARERLARTRGASGARGELVFAAYPEHIEPLCRFWRQYIEPRRMCRLPEGDVVVVVREEGQGAMARRLQALSSTVFTIRGAGECEHFSERYRLISHYAQIRELDLAVVYPERILLWLAECIGIGALRRALKERGPIELPALVMHQVLLANGAVPVWAADLPILLKTGAMKQIDEWW